MSDHPTPPDPNRPLQIAAAGLGGVTFLVGFLPFYSTGNNGISGYALGTPTSAAIGFSVLAGLLVGAELIPARTRPGPVTYAAPAHGLDAALLPLAAGLTALLLALANLAGKGSLSGEISFGFVLFLLALLAQSAVLAYLWLLRTGRLATRVGGGDVVGPPAGGYGRSGPVPTGPQPWSAGTPGQAGSFGPVYGPFYPPTQTQPPPGATPPYGQSPYPQASTQGWAPGQSSALPVVPGQWAPTQPGWPPGSGPSTPWPSPPERHR